MSVKKSHLYNMAWRELLKQCTLLHRPVTAGEFAKRMGIARSTAMRWLTDMLAEGAIYSFRGVGKNHAVVSTFEPIGRGETWHYLCDVHGDGEEDWRGVDY